MTCPLNIFVLYVNECLYVDRSKRSSRRNGVATRLQQMVRGRRVGRLRSAVYDINQMRVSQEHESVEL